MSTARLFLAHFRMQLAAIFASRRAAVLMIVSACVMPAFLVFFGWCLDNGSPQSVSELLLKSLSLFLTELPPLAWGVLMTRSTHRGASRVDANLCAIYAVPVGRRLRLVAESFTAITTLAVSCLPLAIAATAIDIFRGIDAPSLAESVSKRVELLFFITPIIVIVSNRALGFWSAFLQLLVASLAYAASCTRDLLAIDAS